ncbi:tRNA uridine-5-carboxymethylaminomethyl(34) synthesis GTPase MnmE [Desulfovibrio sulfodismutans]|uniref:tRNA modification GTPase MnmE n=1 Tax=Desulfolutivibrio sulfodismutans TaxID=63561 RepID=A0A7K3NJ02_9BACT|nr:tRNA uridine-5-carboxymethylaminomethyl(34) synthesis GTPase MnmE [Desulfolutivibrio sulfodismutans]NDY56067.1 tRNA uridine-5-carboxymethylaminomethyl(34) synthesis GTPase MnmE [Desulfolutivibrio sulfodismutans]QLA12322.1 tRNA uridine-5-carboxymethylaminomethyl(34) synthesis GTPase MnmE [Desulfolutivibrio sulfodismutans DSM 3696]
MTTSTSPPDADRDMIVARATPPGAGGLAVIRLSGRGCRQTALALFRSSRPNFTDLRPYRLHHGHLHTPDGRRIDEVLAAFMPGPGSYTGEDTVEISCHGGPATAAAIVAACIAKGARPAGPGEFTLRAFLNGRMDLSQAQAVAELIAAATPVQADMALARLDGAMGRLARELRQGLEALRAGVCLAVDFPEEDVECLSREEFAARAADVSDRIRKLLEANRRARPFREGASVVLFGRVNAGKSRLFNALLGRERAIVTGVPGTTRDYLEETLDLSGMPVRLTDTAGLRETGDEAEAVGRDRGEKRVKAAELALFVVDGAHPLADGDDDARELALARTLGPARVMAVANKADLPPGDPDPAAVLADMGFETIRVSARTGAGLDALAAAMEHRLGAGYAPAVDDVVPNQREAAALSQALDELADLSRDIDSGVPYDLLGVRLETACAALSDITGEMTPDAVLASIFETFCIGK